MLGYLRFEGDFDSRSVAVFASYAYVHDLLLLKLLILGLLSESVCVEHCVSLVAKLMQALILRGSLT